MTSTCASALYAWQRSIISAKLAPGTPPRSHRAMITKSGSRACLASIAARSFPTISSIEIQRRRGPDFGGNVWSSMWASDARLNVFPHGVVSTDGVTVSGVGIRKDRDLYGQDNLPGVVHHIAHTGPGIGPAQLVRRGIASGHVEGVITQRFRHLRANGIDPAR